MDQKHKRPPQRLAEEALAPDPIDEASSLHDRAVASRTQGQYAKAKALSLRSLRLLEKAVGPDHPDVANVLNTLAGVHEDQGEYAEAERLYQRVGQDYGQGP